MRYLRSWSSQMRMTWYRTSLLINDISFLRKLSIALSSRPFLIFNLRDHLASGTKSANNAEDTKSATPSYRYLYQKCKSFFPHQPKE